MPDFRQQARAAALQALYLWEVGRVTPDDALETFWAEHELEADETFRAFAAHSFAASRQRSPISTR